MAQTWQGYETRCIRLLAVVELGQFIAHSLRGIISTHNSVIKSAWRWESRKCTESFYSVAAAGSMGTWSTGLKKPYSWSFVQVVQRHAWLWLRQGIRSSLLLFFYSPTPVIGCWFWSAVLPARWLVNRLLLLYVLLIGGYALFVCNSLRHRCDRRHWFSSQRKTCICHQQQDSCHQLIIRKTMLGFHYSNGTCSDWWLRNGTFPSFLLFKELADKIYPA